MRLHLVQFHPEVNDKKANLARILDHVDNALAAGADLVAFGECALVGYDPGGQTKYYELAEPVPGPTTKKVAARLKGTDCLVVFGMAESDRGNIYNCAPMVGASGVVGVARKLYLANFETSAMGTAFAESACFKPGNRVTIVNTHFGRIGIQICYDVCHPEISLAQSLAGCWLIVNPFAMPSSTGKTPAQSPYALARAYDYTVCLAGINLVGQQGGEHYGGGTCVIVGRDGVKAQASGGKQAREEVLQYDIDPAEIYTARARYPILKDSRPELMKQLWDIARDGWCEDRGGAGGPSSQDW